MRVSGGRHGDGVGLASSQRPTKDTEVTPRQRTQPGEWRPWLAPLGATEWTTGEDLETTRGPHFGDTARSVFHQDVEAVFEFGLVNGVRRPCGGHARSVRAGRCDAAPAGRLHPR